MNRVVLNSVYLDLPGSSSSEDCTGLYSSSIVSGNTVEKTSRMSPHLLEPYGQIVPEDFGFPSLDGSYVEIAQGALSPNTTLNKVATAYKQKREELSCSGCGKEVDCLHPQLSSTDRTYDTMQSPDYQHPVKSIDTPSKWIDEVMARLGENHPLTPLLSYYKENQGALQLSLLTGKVHEAWNEGVYSINEKSVQPSEAPPVRHKSDAYHWSDATYDVGSTSESMTELSLKIFPCGHVYHYDCLQGNDCTLETTCGQIANLFAHKVLKMDFNAPQYEMLDATGLSLITSRHYTNWTREGGEVKDNVSFKSGKSTTHPSATSIFKRVFNGIWGAKTLWNRSDWSAFWGRRAVSLMLATAGITVPLLVKFLSSKSSMSIQETPSPEVAAAIQNAVQVIQTLPYVHQMAMPNLSVLSSATSMGAFIDALKNYLGISGVVSACKDFLVPQLSPLATLSFTAQSIQSALNVLETAKTKEACLPFTTSTSSLATSTSTIMSSMTTATTTLTATSTIPTTTATTTLTATSTIPTTTATTTLTATSTIPTTTATTTLTATSTIPTTTATTTSTATSTIPTTTATTTSTATSTIPTTTATTTSTATSTIPTTTTTTRTSTSTLTSSTSTSTATTSTSATTTLTSTTKSTTLPTTSTTFGSMSFQTAVNYGVGTNPFGVTATDLNGDGALDLAVANEYSDNISILIGNGNGTFRTAVNYGVEHRPMGVVSADFNGDKKIDLAVNGISPGVASVLLGKGDGTLQAAVDYAAGTAYRIATADLNRDGTFDLVVVNSAANTVSVLSGNGDGTFQTALSYPTREIGSAPYPVGITIADLNRDGKPDVAVANKYIGTVAVFLGNGDGTLQTAVQYGVGYLSNPEEITSADFNNDGKPDLAVTCSNKVSVRLGNGDGTFQTAVDYTTVSNPRGIITANFNEDQKPDLVVTSGNSKSIGVMLGNGDGSFQAPITYGVGSYPKAVIAADFNGDGKPDLAVTNYDSNDVSILLS